MSIVQVLAISAAIVAIVSVAFNRPILWVSVVLLAICFFIT